MHNENKYLLWGNSHIQFIVLVESDLAGKYFCRLPIQKELSKEKLAQGIIETTIKNLTVINTHEEVLPWELLTEFSGDYGYIRLDEKGNIERNDESRSYKIINPSTNKVIESFELWDVLVDEDKDLIKEYLKLR